MAPLRKIPPSFARGFAWTFPFFVTFNVCTSVSISFRQKPVPRRRMTPLRVNDAVASNCTVSPSRTQQNLAHCHFFLACILSQSSTALPDISAFRHTNPPASARMGENLLQKLSSHMLLPMLPEPCRTIQGKAHDKYHNLLTCTIHPSCCQASRTNRSPTGRACPDSAALAPTRAACSSQQSCPPASLLNLIQWYRTLHKGLFDKLADILQPVNVFGLLLLICVHADEGGQIVVDMALLHVRHQRILWRSYERYLTV